MQRTLILGCCGAGKSTFAGQLHAITGLPLIHLDQHYYRAGWNEPEKAAWTATVRELSERPRWIMDGNYAGTLDLRLSRADTVIFLDYPTLTCLWRITKRILRYRGRVRPAMPPGCRERFDGNFYRYVATYRRERRPGILDKLNEVRGTKQIHIFSHDGAARHFLENRASS